MAAFINTFILIIVAALLAFESIKRFQDTVVIDSDWVIVLAFGDLIINWISALILKQGLKKKPEYPFCLSSFAFRCFYICCSTHRRSTIVFL